MNDECLMCGGPLASDERTICYGCAMTDEDVEMDAQRAREEMEDEGLL